MWTEVDALVDVLVGEALPLLLVENPTQPMADGHPHGPQHQQQQQQQQQQQRMSSQHVANTLYAMGRCVYLRYMRYL